MTQFSLRPVAGPVTVAAPAEVRGTSGDRLAGLASALSNFNSGLEVYGQAALDASRRDAQTWAQAEHLKRQYANMDALKQAQDRGELPETANPWGMIYLRALVARDQVRDGLLQVETEFTTGAGEDLTAIRKSQSVNALDSWAGQRIAKMVEGMDPTTTAAVSGVVDEWRGAFLGRTQDAWARERTLATDIGLQREVGHMLSPLIGEAQVPGPRTPEQTARADAMWASLQGTIDTAARVGSAEKVRASVMSAVVSLASAGRSPEIIDNAMQRLHIGGITLGQLALPGELAKAHEVIEDAIADDFRKTRLTEKDRRDTAVDAVLAGWNAQRNAAAARGEFLSPDAVAVDVSKLPPDEQVRVGRIIDEIAAKDVGRHVSVAFEGVDLTSSKALNVAEQLLASGQPGVSEAVDAVLRRRAMLLQGQYPARSSIEAVTRLQSVLTDTGMSTRDKFALLAEVEKSGGLSYEDVRAYTSSIAQLGRVDRQAAAHSLAEFKQRTMNDLTSQVIGSPEFMASNALSLALDGSVSLPLDQRLRIENAGLQFDQAFNRLLADNPNPTLDDVTNAMQKVRDNVMGPAADTSTSAKAVNIVSQIVSNPSAAAQAGVLTWVGDHFEAVIDGKPQRMAGLRMFKSSEEVIAGSESQAASLGITKPDDVSRFIESQAMLLQSPNDRARVWEWAMRKAHGDDVFDQAQELRHQLDIAQGGINSWLSVVAGLSDISTISSIPPSVLQVLGMSDKPSVGAGDAVGVPKATEPRLGPATLGKDAVFSKLPEIRKKLVKMQEASTNLKVLPNGEADLEAARALLGITEPNK